MLKPMSPSPSVQQEDAVTYEDPISEAPEVKLNANGIANYFLGFWNSAHASEALKYMEFIEKKSSVRTLQKEYGCWRPPPEVADILKKPNKLPKFSNLPSNKDTRNLKFVLKMLGCSLHENRPYKQFLKAQSIRQRRRWLYEYGGPADVFSRSDFIEPICLTRMKRLFHFFPDRFKLEDDNVFFNNQLLTYDDDKRVFYISAQDYNGVYKDDD